MKYFLTILPVSLFFLPALSQSRAYLREIMKEHSRGKMGYTIKLAEGSGGCATYKRHIYIRHGEFYLETCRKDIKIESVNAKFTITNTSKKTHLNVCHYYKEDSVVYVTLFKGHAFVHFKGWNHNLKPGGYAKITRDSIQVSYLSDYEFDSEVDRSWTKKGFYQFYNKPMDMIINRIARAHSLNVKYVKKPQTLVSGEIPFYRWTSIRNQMVVLQELIDFDYTFENDTLVIQ